MEQQVPNAKIVKPYIRFIKKPSRFFISLKPLTGSNDDKENEKIPECLIIDSTGQVFNVKKYAYKKKSLLNSIIVWAIVGEVEPVIEGEIGYMSLDDLKEKIINHIKEHPRQGWTGVDVSTKVIIEKVRNFNNYTDLIMYFSYFKI